MGEFKFIRQFRRVCSKLGGRFEVKKLLDGKLEIMSCTFPLLENVSVEAYGDLARVFIGGERSIDFENVPVAVGAEESKASYIVEPREGITSASVRGAFSKVEIWHLKGTNRFEVHLKK